MPVDSQIATMADLAKQSNNDVIIFSVIIIIALIIVMIPLYKMMMSNRKQQAEIEATRQTQQMEREKQVLQVVSENSSIISELKSMLATSNTSTNATLTRIHERIDSIGKNISELTISQTKVESTLSRQERDLEKLLTGQREILLNVSDDKVESK